MISLYKVNHLQTMLLIYIKISAKADLNITHFIIFVLYSNTRYSITAAMFHNFWSIFEM